MSAGVCWLAWLGGVGAALADDQSTVAARQLTLQRIFSSDEFRTQKRRLNWAASGDTYQSLEASPDHADAFDLVEYDAGSGQRRVVVAAGDLIPSGRKRPLVVRGFHWSADGRRLLIFTNTRRVWRTHTRGDYWLFDLRAKALRQIGATKKSAHLMFAKFCPRGMRVAYVYENDLYVEHLETRHSTRLTHRDSPEWINGTSDWVYEEEFRLRDGFRWSADGCHIAYWQFDTRGMRAFTLIDNTTDIYPRLTQFKYPKAGETNPACRVGVVSVDGGATRWMQIPGDPREHYLPRMDWVGSKGELLVQQFNRLQNTVRLFLADTDSGDVRCAHTETDDAWLDLQQTIAWVDDGQGFLWLSERSGWRQIERIARQDGAIRSVTNTDYDVISIVHVDREAGYVYYLAAPHHPEQRYLYRARLDGAGSERVTPPEQPGTHSYQVAPGGRWALHSYSRFDQAPVTDLIRLPDHTSLRVVLPNVRLKQALQSIERPQVEFFRTEIASGVSLDGWLLSPRGVVRGKKYPVLIYVYGEPAGQTVLDRWHGTRYLWHTFLTQQGYFVLSLDNRGTPAPKGRAWRKSIYRQVGILAAEEQAAALKKVLLQHAELDADRVGIWGWSGGGSMTLNALFRYPDLYHVGISIAPVSNQRFYDTIYQERYMGLPADNVQGYRNGSPITHAHQLQGDLLLIHGTGDDNVHYQSLESLVNRLVAANKPFSMMAYPNRTHSIREGRNTTRHLYETMYNFLSVRLPPGPR
jgi:dipeptidyl-peptidase-4